MRTVRAPPRWRDSTFRAGNSVPSLIHVERTSSTVPMPKVRMAPTLPVRFLDVERRIRITLSGGASVPASRRVGRGSGSRGRSPHRGSGSPHRTSLVGFANCVSFPRRSSHPRDMIRVYAYDKCSTCRKALKFLAARGVTAQVIPIREQPPTKAELKQMLARVGSLRKLFNTSGLDYKKLNLKSRLPKFSEAEALDLLATNGNL